MEGEGGVLLGTSFAGAVVFACGYQRHICCNCNYLHSEGRGGGWRRVREYWVIKVF